MLSELMEHIAQDLQAKMQRVNEAPVERLAQAISERSKANSQSGRAFGNDRYDNEYSPKYAKANNKPISPVTLRNGSNRIEKQRIEVSTGNGASIRFETFGDVFNYHDKGINYKKVGFRQRSIFPKSHDSVPDEMVEQLKQDVWEVLSGR